MTDRPGTGCRATVVITTHDRADYARRAIRSALAQTITDLEVVLVDDGSTPPFEPETDDPRLRVVRRQSPGGMCAARNAGLAEARGAWVTFLDDDDELVPEMLERALAAGATSALPAPVAVMTGMAIVAPDGAELDRCVPPSLRKGEHYLLEGRGDLRSKNGLVIPTEVARRIGGWDPQFEAFEADDFGIRLNLAASIQPCPSPLYRMTHHGAARLTSRRVAIPRDMERTLAKHRILFRAHRRSHARYMSTIGMYQLRVGRWSPAVRWCLRGLARDPLRARAWLYAAVAVAGPRALGVARRLRAPEANVPTWVLMRRRARKYARRLGDAVRAVASAPVAAATRSRLPALVPASVVDRRRSVLLLGIYRYDNAPVVASIAEVGATQGWDVRLWALDRTHPRLAASTVGVSRGAKFPLLDRLVREIDDLDSYDWVVVVDDDVVFTRGSVVELLAVAEQAGLDLVQPAHVELSHRNNEVTLRRPLAVARRTTFVEIGPIFAARAPWTACVVERFGHHTMGWGLELEWSDLAARGLRLGVVDAVPMRHLRPAGKGYDWKEQHARLLGLLEERGLASFADVQRTLATWRPWQASPGWSSTPAARARPS